MPLTAQRSYDITPGSDLEDNAGFIPLSVLVDNYSPYWLLLPDAGRYVPPYTSGTVLPLIHANINRATWSNPPLSGLSTQSYIATAGFAHLTYVAETLAYVAGSSVPNSVLSQQQAFSVAEGGTLNVTLNFLAQGVRIDNPGGTAYTIVGTNLIIPSWTTAWLANFTTPFNTITIQPIANPNGTVNTTNGGPLVATFYAQQVTSSGGSPYTLPTTVISYVQSASASGSSVSSLIVTASQKPAIGDLLVIIVQAGSAAAPTCSGFTNTGVTVTNGAGYTLSALYRIADGTETTSFTITGTSLDTVSFLEYANLPRGIFISGSTLLGSSSTTIPSISLTGAYIPYLFIYVVQYSSTSSISTVPTGFTSRITVSAPKVTVMDEIVGLAGTTASGTGTLVTASLTTLIALNFA